MKAVLLRCAQTAFIVAALLVQAGVGEATPTVSVRYNPQRLHLVMSTPRGPAQGSRLLDVAVSRRDPSTFCDKVVRIEIRVTGPGITDIRRVTKDVGSAGLCNFDEVVQVEMVRPSDLFCQQSEAGRVKSLERKVTVALHLGNGSEVQVDRKDVPVNVVCPCTPLTMKEVKANPVLYIGGKLYPETWVVDGRLSRLGNPGLFGVVAFHEPLQTQVDGQLPPGTSIQWDLRWDGTRDEPYLRRPRLAGRPTAEGDYRFTVKLADSCPHGAQTAQQAFTVAVRCGQLDFPEGLTLPPARQGTPYSYQLRTICSTAYTPQRFSAEYVPEGLTVSRTGLISGTPTRAGLPAIEVVAAGDYSAPAPWSGFPEPGRVRLTFAVQDGAPPRLRHVTATPATLPSQGGPVTLTVWAEDNVGVQTVTATILQPDGRQSGLRVPTVGTPSRSLDVVSGTWSTTWALPPNTGTTAVVYGIKVALADGAGNLTEGAPVTITVAPASAASAVPVPPGAVTGTPPASAGGPQVHSVTATPAVLGEAGGEVTVAVQAADGRGVKNVTALVVRPDGSQHGMPLPLVAGTTRMGTWGGKWPVPGNTGGAAQQYTIKATVTDSDNRTVTSVPVTVTVSARTAAQPGPASSPPVRAR